MSDQLGDAAGAGRLAALGWRSVVAGVTLFAAGVVVGATLLGDIGEIPCYEVQERAQPARDVLTDTFGSGERGRQAAQELLGLVREHPGCFDPGMAEFLEAQQQTPGESETVEATEMPTESGAPTG